MKTLKSTRRNATRLPSQKLYKVRGLVRPQIVVPRHQLHGLDGKILEVNVTAPCDSISLVNSTKGRCEKGHKVKDQIAARTQFTTDAMVGLDMSQYEKRIKLMNDVFRLPWWLAAFHPGDYPDKYFSQSLSK